jgi:hypothetical protein
MVRSVLLPEAFAACLRKAGLASLQPAPQNCGEPFSFFFSQRRIDLSAAADSPQSIVGYLELSALCKCIFFLPERGNSTKIQGGSSEEK